MSSLIFVYLDRILQLGIQFCINSDVKIIIKNQLDMEFYNLDPLADTCFM